MKNLENFASRFNISSRKIHNNKTYIYVYKKREKESSYLEEYKLAEKTGSG